MTAIRKAPAGRQRRVMVSEITDLAERFWADLDALAARAEPDQRANVLTLGIAAVGHRLCDRAQPLILAAVGVEAEHLAGSAT